MDDLGCCLLLLLFDAVVDCWFLIDSYPTAGRATIAFDLTALTWMFWFY